MSHQLPPLPYDAAALEPHIDAQTMQIHHGKHHAAYVDNLNAALEKLSGKKVSVTTRQDPELLGGVVAKVGDTVYDGSLRTQLRTLRDELSK